MPRALWRLPVLKQIRQSGPLNGLLRMGYGDHWGRFATREEATAFLRPRDKIGYDNDDVVQINIDFFTAIHPFDWPVLFFLQELIQAGKLRTVTDFGGHVGVKYHAFRTMLTFPQAFSWQVVDVGAICREGRKRAGPDENELVYFERAQDTRPCDALLCSGSIQYSDLGLPELLAALPQRPGLILLNKVPIGEAEGFYTLESFGIGRMPYRIFSEAELAGIRAELGYRRRARWDIPHRAFSVPFQRGVHEIAMIGEAWEREEMPPAA